MGWQSLPNSIPEDKRRFWLPNQWLSSWGSAQAQLTTWAHMFWGYEKPTEKSQAQVFYFLWYVFIFFGILFYFFPILTAILAKCYGLFLQWWFCSVTSPCIFEAFRCSHPLHRAKSELLWNFGVSISFIGEDILKFTSVTLLLQYPCWKTTTYHRYIIEICRPVLMACTWKTRVLLVAFWDKISIFHLG